MTGKVKNYTKLESKPKESGSIQLSVDTVQNLNYKRTTLQDNIYIKRSFRDRNAEVKY